MCSGALALAAYPGSPVYFSNPVSILPDIEQARGYDQVIVCDIAINISTANILKDKIDSIARDATVFYIDHHPLPEGFDAPWLINDEGASASELTYVGFRDKLDPAMSRVSLYGAIADYRDNTEFVCQTLLDWDKPGVYYQAGTLSQGMEAGRRDYDFKRDIVKKLAENTLPSEMDELVKNALEASRKEDETRRQVEKDVIRMRNIAYVIDLKGGMSKAAIYCRVYGRTSVGLAAEYREHKDVYDFSVRAKGDIDLNSIVSRAAVKVGGTGGGHPLAAGGRIPASRFREFLLELDAAAGNATGNK